MREPSLPYTVTAIRQDEKMQSVRNSSLIALAKARVWESEGWRVRIADPQGREHDIAQLDELTVFKPEKITALSAMLPLDETLFDEAPAREASLEKSPAFQAEDVDVAHIDGEDLDIEGADIEAIDIEEVHLAGLHGPWPVETHGPWFAQSQDRASESTRVLLSS
jgi:hypothetical protein